MFKTKLFHLKGTEFDSSIDSSLSDKKEGATTKEINKGTNSNLLDLENYKVDFNQNMLIKEKLKKKLKDNRHLLNKTDPVSWRSFYENFVNESLKKDQINLKEVEIRINSVLNKYDEKTDRILKSEKLENNTHSSNNLLYKNNYMQNDKNKFIQVIMSKYNEVDLNTIPNKSSNIKKSHTSRNHLRSNIKLNTIGTNLTNQTKTSTTADQKSHRTIRKANYRRSLKSESEAKKHLVFKDVLTKLTKGPLNNSDKKLKFQNFSKQNSIKNESGNYEIVESHKKLKSDLQTELKTASRFLEQLRAYDKAETINYEKNESEEKKKKTMPISKFKFKIQIFNILNLHLKFYFRYRKTDKKLKIIRNSYIQNNY